MKIFVMQPMPDEGIAMLKAKGYEIVDGAERADAVLSSLSKTLDKAFIDALPATVKIIANYAAGYNNIDVAAAKARGIVVTNTPDVLTEAVAEFTIGLMLAIAKRISETDRFIRAGLWQGGWMWNFMLGMELKGKTLGIVGPGRIGSRVGEMAKVLGMNVLECGPDDNLDAFLPKCDVVSLHVPLLDSTKHLINKARLKLMKPTAYLINTARGPVVDEAALAAALKAKQIAGAALDVFETEPKVNPELLKLENVVLTPHIASATLKARTDMAIVAATNIIEALEGRTPPNVAK